MRESDYGRYVATFKRSRLDYSVIRRGGSQWGEWSMPSRAAAGIVVGHLAFLFYRNGSFLGYIDESTQIFTPKAHKA